MFTMSAFTDWFNEEMKRQGLSQAELSRMSGVSQAQISRIADGSREPGLDFVQKISRALRIPVEVVTRYASGEIRSSDEWVERQSHRLSLIEDPDLRKMAESLINNLVEQSETRKPSGKKKTSER